MPRHKVEMKLIEDHKKRKVTFKNRSDGLVEKTRQIATLCGCDALCICYDPMAASGAGGLVDRVKTWPADREEVHKLIRKYRDMPADRFRKVMTPLTFNVEELNKEQRRLLKVQQCGAGKLVPWDSSFDDASVTDLNYVLGKLDETMQRVQQRMVELGLVQDDKIVPASNAAVAAPMPHVMSLPDNAFSFGGSLPDAGSMVTQYYELPHHDHMLPQQFPLQPPCHGYQMPLPYLSCYQMPPSYLSYQMPPPTLRGLPEFGATAGYATNVVNGASAASEFYDGLMQGPPEFGATTRYATNVVNGASAASEFYNDLMQGPPEFGATTGYATNVVNGASAASEFYDDLMQGFDAGGAYASDDVLGQAFSAAGAPSAGYNLAHHATAGIWPGSEPNNPMDGAAFQFPLRNDLNGPPGVRAAVAVLAFKEGFRISYSS